MFTQETIRAMGSDFREALKVRTDKALEDLKDIPAEERARFARASETVIMLAGRVHVLNDSLSPAELAEYKVALSTVAKYESAALVIGRVIGEGFAAEFAKAAGKIAMTFGKAAVMSLGVPIPILG